MAGVQHSARALVANWKRACSVHAPVTMISIAAGLAVVSTSSCCGASDSAGVLCACSMRALALRERALSRARVRALFAASSYPQPRGDSLRAERALSVEEGHGIARLETASPHRVR